jgi:RNA polymerase sigma-70 factor (ECF subfamily)
MSGTHARPASGDALGDDQGLRAGDDEFTSTLQAAAAGADWAWRIIVARYSGPLLGYLRLRAPGDPEDALSEAWMSAASTIRSFSGDESAFRSWLFVIAHRRAIDAARRRSRRPVVVEEAPTPDSAPVEASAETTALEAMSGEAAMELLSALTPDQRSVIALRVIADLSLEDTARVLEKRVGAIKALQKRGLEALRRMLDEPRFPAV